MEDIATPKCQLLPAGVSVAEVGFTNVLVRDFGDGRAQLAIVAKGKEVALVDLDDNARRHLAALLAASNG
ncbi:hypothetical protein [Halorhodospira sp. 9622]|uniref:hypothetical protein n=1 Tax=Halorhodospira sp. 9622 TaxID=2899136 RepID=UPI001EE7BF4C|nr:hypothetical protein [Halorhodospira sp. 9622]MCG5538978.1 hypothetical protein [Halorhodospira sp. 9622]